MNVLSITKIKIEFYCLKSAMQSLKQKEEKEKETKPVVAGVASPSVWRETTAP